MKLIAFLLVLSGLISAAKCSFELFFSSAALTSSDVLLMSFTLIMTGLLLGAFMSNLESIPKPTREFPKGE